MSLGSGQALEEQCGEENVIVLVRGARLPHVRQ